MVAILIFPFLLFAYATLAKIIGKNEEETEGIILLDAITFPKVVPNTRYAVATLISSKKEISEYATASIRADYFSFAHKANRLEVDNVLFSQIIVNGAQNAPLSKRIGVKNIDLRYPKLFFFAKNSSVSIPYPDSSGFNDVDLGRFVSKYADFFLGAPGLIEDLSVLAKNFITSDSEGFSSLLAKGESIVKSLTVPEQIENGSMYVKTMRKIIEVGYSYVDTEIGRLQKILASEQMKGNKKLELNKKLNIIQEFTKPSSHQNEEEL